MVGVSLTTLDSVPDSPCAVLQNYIFQPGYPLLSAEEKLDLLETGICPSTVQLNDCTDMKMNYGIDWNLLKPAMTNALQLAFTDAYKNHTTTV